MDKRSKAVKSQDKVMHVLLDYCHKCGSASTRCINSGDGGYSGDAWQEMRCEECDTVWTVYDRPVEKRSRDIFKDWRGIRANYLDKFGSGDISIESFWRLNTGSGCAVALGEMVKKLGIRKFYKPI